MLVPMAEAQSSSRQMALSSAQKAYPQLMVVDSRREVSLDFTVLAGAGGLMHLSSTAHCKDPVTGQPTSSGIWQVHLECGYVEPGTYSFLLTLDSGAVVGTRTVTGARTS